MMPQLIEANGQRFEFPDEATNEQIGQALDELFSGQAMQAPSSQPVISAEIAQPTQPPTRAQKIGDFFTGSLRETEATKAPEVATAIGKLAELQTLRARQSFAPQELEAFKQRVEAEGIPFSSVEAIEKAVSQENLNKIGAALLITQNPQEQIKIIQKNIPDATFSEDGKGNIIANIAGVNLPLNKPGISPQDISQAIVQTAAFTPGVGVAGRAAALATKAPAAVAKILALGSTAAATQSGIETAQKELGGDFNVGDVVLAGVLAGAFQGLTDAGGNVIRRFINAKGGKFSSQEISDLIKTSEREGVDFFVDDAARTAFVKQVNQAAEKIPVLGTAKGKIRQSGQQLAAAKKLQQSITKEIDDIAETAQKGFSKQLERQKAVVGERFAKAAEELDQLGEVNTPKFAQNIDDAIEKLSSSPSRLRRNKELISTLEAYKKDKTANFSDARELVSEINDDISSFFKGDRAVVGKKGVGTLIEVRKALESDIDDLVKSRAAYVQYPQAQKLYKEATDLYKKAVVPFIDNKRLARIVKSEEPEEVFKYLFAETGTKKGIRSRAKYAYKLMDEKGREAVKAEIINKAFDKALTEQGGKEILSAANFARALEGFDNVSSAFFKPIDKKRIDGLVKLFRATQGASQVAAAPPTGAGLFVPGAIIAGAVEPVTTTSLAGMALSTKLLFQSKVGRNLLLGLSKKTAGTKAFDKQVDAINTFLQKAVVAQAAQED